MQLARRSPSNGEGENRSIKEADKRMACDVCPEIRNNAMETIELTNYKVRSIIYPNGEYRLGRAVAVIDECSFYRIDGTHIFDKHKIKRIDRDGDKIEIEMTDKTVILEIEQ